MSNKLFNGKVYLIPVNLNHTELRESLRFSY